MLKSIATFTTAAVVAAFAAGAALAEEPLAGYSVSDVVKHFSATANLGKTRALCIGTPTECGAEEAAAEPEPFNLQVQFQLGSAELTPTARQQLDVFAEAATGALSRARFNIDGHTDASGGAELNLSLSKQRAASVVNYLVDRGVPAQRLVSSGYGESQPRHPDPYNGANRRVEASLVDVR
ncbi:MAG: OmpA family protein [Pseudomonadota bacterium]